MPTSPRLCQAYIAQQREGKGGTIGNMKLPRPPPRYNLLCARSERRYGLGSDGAEPSFQGALEADPMRNKAGRGCHAGLH